MDSQQLIDYLIPIIFLIVWVVSGIFGKRNEEDIPGPTPVPRPQGRQFDPLEELFEQPEYDEDEAEDDFEDPFEPAQEEASVARVEDYQEEISRLEKAAQAARLQAQAAATNDKLDYKVEHKERHSHHGGKLAWLRKGGRRVLQRAIIETEVLGTPVGMRNKGKIGPLWNE